MKKRLTILALISTSCFASGTVEDVCKVEGGGVMAGYLCVEQKNEKAEKEFNENYQKVLIRLSEEETILRESWSKVELVEPFQKAQRAWLSYRDAECFFSSVSSTTSPWQGVQIEECKLEMTLERVEYFKSIY